MKYALFWTNKSLFTTLLQLVIWNERKIKNAVKSVIIYYNEFYLLFVYRSIYNAKMHWMKSQVSAFALILHKCIPCDKTLLLIQ